MIIKLCILPPKTILLIPAKTGCNWWQPVFDRSFNIPKSGQLQPQPYTTVCNRLLMVRLPSVGSGWVPVFFPVAQPDLEALVTNEIIRHLHDEED